MMYLVVVHFFCQLVAVDLEVLKPAHKAFLDLTLPLKEHLPCRRRKTRIIAGGRGGSLLGAVKSAYAPVEGASSHDLDTAGDP